MTVGWGYPDLRLERDIVTPEEKLLLRNVGRDKMFWKY